MWGRNEVGPATLRPAASGNQLFHHVAVNVGQSKIATSVAKSQLRVVEAKKLEQGRVEIVDMNGIFHRLKTKFVSCAVNVTTTHPSTRQPHREAVMIMVAAIDLSGIRAGRR